MGTNKIVLCCWDCGKEYSLNVYPPFLQYPKLVKCSCGGQVVSNSGKVMLKLSREEENK
jgi:hypothetical protein